MCLLRLHRLLMELKQVVRYARTCKEMRAPPLVISLPASATLATGVAFTVATALTTLLYAEVVTQSLMARAASSFAFSDSPSCAQFYSKVYEV
jgi:hypothetical protein